MITIDPKDDSLKMSATLDKQIDAVIGALSVLDRQGVKGAARAIETLDNAFSTVKRPSSGKKAASENPEAA